MSLAILIVALMAGAMAHFRFSPVDVARWHQPPASLVPPSAGWRDWVLYPPEPTDGVQPMPGGAYVAAFFAQERAAEVLARLEVFALASPRTRRIAGSAESGMITWQTRSAFWGFPDYTTAYAEPRLADGATMSEGDGVMLYLVGRLRFGSSDFGVNAARLTQWMLLLRAASAPDASISP